MRGETATPVDVDVRAWTGEQGPARHLYVHWPFCARKCPYCDFNSHAGRDRQRARYAEALIEEARMWRGHVDAVTVFVGGGTPTYVEVAGLEAYLAGVRDALGFDAVREWTIEANPGSIDPAKVRALRRVGVNRVSVGVQSFDDRHLGTLGRIHDGAQAERAIGILHDAGLPRYSLDLILATPEQTLDDQRADLERAVRLAPEHISAYVLTFEEGTAFTRLLEQGRMAAPDPDRELAHLHLARDLLVAAGYDRYEISNFAQDGAESQHNLAYWENADWIGIGAGAHSHVAGRRWAHERDPMRYAAAVEAGRVPVATTELVAPPVQAFEHLMMGLRLARGVDLAHVHTRTGFDVASTHAGDLEAFEREGLLARSGSRIHLTERGLDLANTVIARFHPGD